ncbi:MAG: sensor histidine kinase [Bacillota bacterium]
MKTTLRTRLTMSYIFIALLCVFLISIVSNLYLEKYFREYVRENQEKTNKEIVDMISRQYSIAGKWEHEAYEDIGIYALEQGLIIKIIKEDGIVVWDTTKYNSGMCQEMLMDLTQNMMSRYPNWKGSYQQKEYAVTINNVDVGSVEVGYYGPFYFSDTDLNFINALNRVILAIGMFSLLAALGLGYNMARNISIPIKQVTGTAELIAGGNFQDKCNTKSSIKEIISLTETVNNLAETLNKQENLRKRLTADVAHELRTPLATLQSHIEAMIDGIWEADAERLKSCHEEIIRLSKLVGSLEKLARYEHEAIVVNRTYFSLSELMGAIMLNFESEFSSKGIRLEYEGGNLSIYADRDKLSQILVNLISNALKYTQNGGSVQISDKSLDNKAIITVEDNGTGISKEDLPHIFERFYRADKSRNRDTGGSGIGLAIAKTLAEAHGGSISVESEAGRGTKFTLVLPQ